MSARVDGEPLRRALRLVAAHDNIFQQEVFDELAAAIRELVPAVDLGVVLPDGPNHFRVYAVSSGRARGIVPLTVRLPSLPDVRQRVYGSGEIHLCEDTAAGEPLEQLLMQAGCSAYLDVPIHNPTGEIVADLVIAFETAAIARDIRPALVQEIADIIGYGVERAVKVSRERRWAMILATSGDAMLAWDGERLITDANDAAAALVGCPRDELIGESIDEVLELPPAASGTSAATKVPPSGQRLPLRTADGRRRTVAATITDVEVDPTVGAHALVRDLTEVVAAETERTHYLASLRELEERHRNLLDHAPLLILELAPETLELVFLNRYAEELFGLPRHEALSEADFVRRRHVDPEGVAAYEQAVETARAGTPSPPYEARLRRTGGDMVTVRGNFHPIYGEGGTIVGIEGVLADVSAEQAARSRLVQVDRLSTLGTLAAGVAHEINNPAAFILLGLDMLARQLKGPEIRLDAADSDNVGNLLNELRDSIQRIVDIARDLRLFAGPVEESGRQSVVDVVSTVESALTLTRGKILERARIERALTDVPPVLMDHGRLAQVLVNLLVNAAQAVPRWSTQDHAVTVKTSSDGQRVQVEVTDTGVGIAHELQERIWAPFFTTKAPHVGTGLGLSISRSIIERAGGRIWVDSPAPGAERGSRFVIELPAAGRAEQMTPISTPIPRIPATRERLLIVEDETALARALAEQLRPLHEIELAKSGEEGLARLTAESYAVVLCDLRMPGMSGEALYREIAATRPEQATGFIFMTGVGFGADVERFIENTKRPVLEKPFTIEAALEQIAKVLARRRREGSLPESPRS